MLEYYRLPVREKTALQRLFLQYAGAQQDPKSHPDFTVTKEEEGGCALILCTARPVQAPAEFAAGAFFMPVVSLIRSCRFICSNQQM